jgi:hypothetical protein
LIGRYFDQAILDAIAASLCEGDAKRVRQPFSMDQSLLKQLQASSNLPHEDSANSRPSGR